MGNGQAKVVLECQVASEILRISRRYLEDTLHYYYTALDVWIMMSMASNDALHLFISLLLETFSLRASRSDFGVSQWSANLST